MLLGSSKLETGVVDTEGVEELEDADGGTEDLIYSIENDTQAETVTKTVVVMFPYSQGWFVATGGVVPGIAVMVCATDVFERVKDAVEPPYSAPEEDKIKEDVLLCLGGRSIDMCDRKGGTLVTTSSAWAGTGVSWARAPPANIVVAMQAARKILVNIAIVVGIQ